jgi:Flp pilus assembly protein TadD
MKHGGLVLSFLLSLLLLSGCATGFSQGQAALRQGRFDEAVTYFEQVLAENPSQTDALVGLGVARYKQGEFDQAAETLERVVAQSPDDSQARLYLALDYIQKQDAFRAEDQLSALQGLKLDARLAAQVARALDVLQSEPLTPPIRAFLATSLETQSQLIQELRQARLEAARARYFATPPSCVIVRRRGALFCI